MKKILIAIALLAIVAQAQTLWTIQSGSRQVGLFPNSSACFEALRVWQSQGGYGYCTVAD